MGTPSLLPCAYTQASATCAAATPFAAATALTASAMAWLAAPASPVKRGLRPRKSFPSRDVHVDGGGEEATAER